MARPTDPFDEMERFFDQLTQFGGGMGADLSVDIVDEGDAFVVTADLPGYSSEDIDVELLDDRRVRLSAEYDRSESTESDDFVKRERRRQSTSRTVTLPEPVDETDTGASYTNGVLTVRLGKETAGGDSTDIPVS